MLSVGRELKITHKQIVCRSCSWQGDGAELSAGLIKVASAHIYSYAYRCPECGSFEVARKGKLLLFRRPSPAKEDEDETTDSAERAMK
jgi:DNA-directed RNA polymerase subunit RPC12/RpoP